MSRNRKPINFIDDIMREVLNDKSIVPIIGSISSDYKVTYNIISPNIGKVNSLNSAHTISDPLRGLYTSLRPLFMKVLSKPQLTSLLIPLWHMYFAKIDLNNREIRLYPPRNWINNSYLRHYEIKIGNITYRPYDYDNKDPKNVEHLSSNKPSINAEIYSPFRVNYLDLNYIPDFKLDTLEKTYFPSLLIYTKIGNKKHLKHLLIFAKDPDIKIRSVVPVCASLDSKIVFIGISCDRLKGILNIDDLHNFVNELNFKIFKNNELLDRGREIEDMVSFDDITKLFKSISLVNTKVYFDQINNKNGKKLFPSKSSSDPLYEIYSISNVNVLRYLYGYRIKFKLFSSYLSPPVIFYEDQNKLRGFGYPIFRTNGILLEINKKKLEKILYGILTIDKELYNILIAKFFLYTKSKNNAFNNDYIGNYIDYERVAENILFGYPDSQIDNKFIEFIMENAAYSLAYLLIRRISSILNTNIDNFILYLDLDNKENKIKIYILEKSSEGLGFTETMTNTIFSNSSSIVQFFDLILGSLYNGGKIDTKNDMCKIRFSATQSKYSRQLNIVRKANSNIDTIAKHAEAILDDWSKRFNTEFPWDFLRNSILKYIRDNDRQLYSKIVSDPGLKSSMEIVYGKYSQVCWDGCIQCIRLPEDYSLLQPDYEIFLTSKRLGSRIIEVFKSYASNSFPSTIDRNNYRGTILNLIDKAKLIIIVSPFFDEEMKYIFNKLLEKFNRKEQMRVLIFTRKTTYNENKDIFEKIDEFTKIYTLDNLHSKIYIFDNNVLWGSVNLTTSSLQRNIETLTISDSIAILYDVLGDFIKSVLEENKLSFSQFISYISR
jgi:hypothetical protein